MNYAEDRLDRRARTSTTCSAAAGLPPQETDDTTSYAQKPSASHELERDLKEAHASIHRHSAQWNCLLTAKSSYTENDTTQTAALRELLSAHRLAGKTLRDGGSNRQAVFHFGLAWKICHLLQQRVFCSSHERSCENVCDIPFCEEWEAVGDYAQMAEFTGFPEVGVMALLFYRAGSFRSCSHGIHWHSIKSKERLVSNGQGCGCGMAECGLSPCYISFSLDSSLIRDMLDAFRDMSLMYQHHRLSNDAAPSALEILNQLAMISGKSSGNTSQDRLLKMQQFMKGRMGSLHVPGKLQFWDESVCTGTTQPLPTVLLLLLLKLLYSSPISGPFLQLACYSIPYLSALLPISSAEGRHLANKFKSHWAYYIFIHALILGERKKKKPGVDKRDVHAPVWDLILANGLNVNRACYNVTERSSGNKNTFTIYMKELLGRLENPIVQTSLLPQMLTFNLVHPPIYVLGDSHVLSLAWQSICISSSSTTMHRTFVPFPSTGIKAWHFRDTTKFFTNYNFRACLQRLTNHANNLSTIIISAGEIDCREGIGGSLLYGYYKNCNDAIEHTVLQYLTSVSLFAKQYNLQVLLMPVAPHAYRSEKNGKALGRAKRRETMHLWNEMMRKELCQNSSHKYPNVFLLDYEEQLRVDDPLSPVGYVLKPSLNADYTHVNSCVVHLIERSINECGCNINLI